MAFPTNATSMISAKFKWQHRYLGEASCEMLYEPNVLVTQIGLQAFTEFVHAGMGNAWKEIGDHETALIGTQTRYLAWEGSPVVERVAFDFERYAGDRGDIVEDAATELDALPPFVSLLIRKYTDHAGRANRGRLFLPFLSEQIQHDGLLDSLNEGDAKAVADFLHTVVDVTDDLGDVVGTASPRLWNLKDNLFVPITRMMACVRLVTRMDRAMKVGQRPLT